MKKSDDFDLSRILSSQARFRVLESLHTLNGRARIRHIEKLTQLAIHSVQVALQRLVAEKVILKSGRKPHPLYALNPRHPAYEILNNVFNLIKAASLRQRARKFDKAAESSLAFSSELRDVTQRARTT